MGYFQVRYDSRVVNYDRRGFIRLVTVLPIQQLAVNKCFAAGDEQPYQPCGISSSEIMFLQLKPKTFIFMDCIAY